jgi:hypothetical protein
VFELLDAGPDGNLFSMPKSGVGGPQFFRTEVKLSCRISCLAVTQQLFGRRICLLGCCQLALRSPYRFSSI